MTGNLHEDVFTFLTMSRCILHRMRNGLDKSSRENQNTFHAQWLFAANRFLYEIMSKNLVDRERPQNTTWHMRVACWISKTTRARTQNYVIFIAFPRQKWFLERASTLRFMYTACLVNNGTPSTSINQIMLVLAYLTWFVKMSFL